MAKKKIKVSIEFTVDEETYEQEADGKNFKEFKEEIRKGFDSDVVEDVKIDLEEIKAD